MTASDTPAPKDRSAWQVFSRRQLLALTGGAAAAAVLAACGDDDGGSSSTSRASGTTAAPATTAGSATSAGAATTAPATTAAGATTSAGAATTAPSSGAGNAAKFGGGGGDGTLKVGFTAPLTGPLAGFGEANPFTLDTINELVADGIMLGDKSYKVEILTADTQSNSDTAATQAGKLITEDSVDLMLAIATPEMINPVADQCEANGVPCLSTLAPWQPYFFGRGGDPAVGFDWTYHFFWGAEQLVAVFVDLWNSVETNKKVGLLCPNDPDGNALASSETGFPAGASAAGYTVVDPGRFETGTADFSNIIGKFKEEGVEIVVGIPIPPDFAAFWTQAKQQNFNPKLVTMAKAVLFASAVEALGDSGDGLASEVWWTPTHPFSSSLTGVTSQQLSDQYTESTGKQWTQFVGFVHALFEVCFDVVSRAASTDKQAIADAAAATNLDTIVGPIAYGKNGLPKNVSPTSLVGGQWVKQTAGATYPFELIVVNNNQSPEIPKAGDLTPLAS
jgi:branched-chain amino acid transport system substrate-binding protein